MRPGPESSRAGGRAGAGRAHGARFAEAQQPRPVDEAERLRLYLLDTRAWCRHCNREVSAECSPRCPGCARLLTLRDVTAAPTTWTMRLTRRIGRALHARYHPRARSRRPASVRPAREVARERRAGDEVLRQPGPLSEDERIRLYLLDHDAACPTCGYDLFGLESAVCPECGTALTIAAIRRGRMVWLTAPFVTGLVGLGLAMIASLVLPVKGVLWLEPEYRETPMSLFVFAFMLLPAAALAMVIGKWINYAMVVAKLPRLERWGLALACWLALGLVVVGVWKM